jgi:hypothetical protein
MNITKNMSERLYVYIVNASDGQDGTSVMEITVLSVRKLTTLKAKCYTYSQVVDLLEPYKDYEMCIHVRGTGFMDMDLPVLIKERYPHVVAMF